MKRICIQVIIPFLVMATVGLGSCKNRKTEGQQRLELDERARIEKEIEESVYPLPTSADVIKLLTDLDVGYIIGISNPVDKASGYLTSRDRAVNIGIYGADLSYATLYNMQQEVINYLSAVRTLANELNMSQIYDESLYNEIKQNFDNRDQLVSLLTDAFNNTYVYLSENGQESLALLVVGGAWVEGMYITTNISESVYHVEGIVKVLLEQKASFELFMDLAKPYSDDPLVRDFLIELEPIVKVYEGLETSLTMKNVEDITKAISTVRDKLTN
jgi:hypothetical protein